jgi:ElaB/YqjD/DUF883 family membrane-anchored ribosome-binding protein
MAEHTDPGEPNTVEQARAEVARSRARISDTLDELEDRLVDKQHALREKLDVKKRLNDIIEKRPLVAVGAVAGLGFLLGLIGGRGGTDAGMDDDEREELRELLREARANGDTPSISVGRSHPSFWQETRAQLVGALTAALVTAVAERLRPHGEAGATSTVDNEPEHGPRRRPARRRPPALDPDLDELDLD